jgi:hypothetical protein
MEGNNEEKKVYWRIVRVTQSSDFPSQSSPKKSDHPVVMWARAFNSAASALRIKSGSKGI